ncbi:MAG: hypothetical protein IPN86_04250 [Saprospiraceae bacterium]|nr:hypothetical protein [Saprospiraceae bacterium]
MAGLDSGLSSDFVAMDIRESLFHLGSITGEVSTDDLLESIFSKFCIKPSQANVTSSSSQSPKDFL